MFKLLSLALILSISSIFASLQEIPIMFDGRVRPLEVAAKMALEKGLKDEEIMKTIEKTISSPSPSPLNSPLEKRLRDELYTLTHQGISPKEIVFLLEERYPLKERIKNLEKSFLIALPSKKNPLEWLPLQALALENYQPKEKALLPIKNFTAFSDQEFKTLQELYLKILNGQEKSLNLFSEELIKGYLSLTSRSSLPFPSLWQLKAELLYSHLPLISLSALFYFFALISFGLQFNYPLKELKLSGFVFFLIAFMMNSLALILRIYILGRPPVSNMFETAIYVPWVTALFSLISYLYFNEWLLLFSSSFINLTLFILIKISEINQSLGNVQAVLNSRYWLIVHVLLVVGSYAAFLLSGILSHIYLISTRFSPLITLPKIILQALYVGTALLIPGTILGGVWAAESWGRFWDWDPKESWAFISSLVYLIVIHSYRFKKVGEIGLALGSVLGLLSISFTWYGVNYILGVGLHSYGFGSGGEICYYFYLLAEALFVLYFMLHSTSSSKVISSSKS